MKLLVHNLLSSRFLKNVTTGYPLKVKATKVVHKESDFNKEFIKRMVPRITWSVFKEAADTVGYGEELPPELSENWEEDENFLKAVHKALVEVEIEEGSLQCPESGREFTIHSGIPNMLANEDEVAA